MSLAKANVVTSVKPLAFITAAIADGVTNTEILLPDGASPHNYALKPSDLVKLNSANLIVWVGKDMEAFLPSLLRNIDDEKQIALTANAAISPLLREGHKHEHDDHDQIDDHSHHQFDMHIWLSPKIAEAAAQVIHDKLRQIYPDTAALLDNNLSTFILRLKETEQIIAKKLNSVQNSGYFVFHDGYSYFEHEFNLNNLGSLTINPAIQPGIKKVYELQTELKTKKAICIFREPQFSPVIIDKIVKGTGVKVGSLDPLGMEIELSKDAYSHFLLNVTQQFLNCLE